MVRQVSTDYIFKQSSLQVEMNDTGDEELLSVCDSSNNIRLESNLKKSNDENNNIDHGNKTNLEFDDDSEFLSYLNEQLSIPKVEGPTFATPLKNSDTPSTMTPILKTRNTSSFHSEEDEDQTNKRWPVSNDALQKVKNDQSNLAPEKNTGGNLWTDTPVLSSTSASKSIKSKRIESGQENSMILYDNRGTSDELTKGENTNVSHPKKTQIKNVAKGERKSGRNTTIVKPFTFHTSNRRRALAPVNTSFVAKTDSEGIYIPFSLPKSVTKQNKPIKNKKSINMKNDHIYILIENLLPKITPLTSISQTKSIQLNPQKSITLLSPVKEEMKKIEFVVTSKPCPVALNASNKGTMPKDKLLDVIKRPTEVKEFVFETSKILANRPRKKSPIEQLNAASSFKATPIPKDIFDRPKGIPPKKESYATVPMSPPITKPHPGLVELIWTSENKAFEFKAKEAPKSMPFEPQFEHKFTHAEPFQFPGGSIREKAKRKWEDHIHETLDAEQKAREFRAKPVKSLLPTTLPLVPEKPLTEPNSFIFRTELFRQKMIQQGSGGFLSDSEETHNMDIDDYGSQSQSEGDYRFKARPMPKSAPFIPKKSTKALTEVDDTWVLNSEIRAESRAMFDFLIRQKSEELEKRKESEVKLEEEVRQEEYRQARKETEFHANPIRKYKQIEIKPSEKKPTWPQTPPFMLTSKSRLGQAVHHYEDSSASMNHAYDMKGYKKRKIT